MNQQHGVRRRVALASHTNQIFVAPSIQTSTPPSGSTIETIRRPPDYRKTRSLCNDCTTPSRGLAGRTIRSPRDIPLEGRLHIRSTHPPYGTHATTAMAAVKIWAVLTPTTFAGVLGLSNPLELPPHQFFFIFPVNSHLDSTAKTESPLPYRSIDDTSFRRSVAGTRLSRSGPFIPRPQGDSHSASDNMVVSVGRFLPGIGNPPPDGILGRQL